MNTQQKQRFFASYYGVNCGIIESLDGIYTIDMISSVDRLRLTHPSKITDAHCVELFDLLFPFATYNTTDEKISQTKEYFEMLFSDGFKEEESKINIFQCEILI